MPAFETHISVSALSSAALVVYGTAQYGWDGNTSSLAFIAGLTGGLLPDLDSDSSKPLRLAGALIGLGGAVAISEFLGSKGHFLNRPWPTSSIWLAGIIVFIIFNSVFIEILRRKTIHRGLFHSMPVPFLYGGLWAIFCMSHGSETATAAWWLAVIGVFSHLILDTLKSRSLKPLKLFSSNLYLSSILWFLTAIVNLLALGAPSIFRAI